MLHRDGPEPHCLSQWPFLPLPSLVESSVNLFLMGNYLLFRLFMCLFVVIGSGRGRLG